MANISCHLTNYSCLYWQPRNRTLINQMYATCMRNKSTRPSMTIGHRLLLPTLQISVQNANLTRKVSFYRGDRPLRRPQAQDLIMHLNMEERQLLIQELQAYAKVADQGSLTSDAVVRPSAAQLRGVAMCSAIPFVGFGFLDNFIMILAGDYIDLSLGATLGISTMAAAALGNLISDVAGVGSAWYVENVSAKIGVTPPLLTTEQLALSSTTFFSYLGKALGVTLGCLLGMFPLIFLHTGEKHEK